MMTTAAAPHTPTPMNAPAPGPSTIAQTSMPQTLLSRVCRGIFAVALSVSFLTPSLSAQTNATNQQVVVADFNHDGISDVLLPSQATPTLSIAFGTLPYGTFSPSVRAVTLPSACIQIVGGGAASGVILAADFNADGFPDIFFTCSTSTTTDASISGVALGNGDGTFAPPVLLTAPANLGATAGDFNKDGKMDLVVLAYPNGRNASYQTPSLLFFAGNGDGTFAQPVASPLGTSATFQPASYILRAPQAADIDGDGYPDIVLTAGYGGTGTPSPTTGIVTGATITINVFANKKDGTFGLPSQSAVLPDVTATLGTYPTVSPNFPQKVLTGSFFSAGATDLASADTGTAAGVFLIKNTSTPNTFSLATPAKTTYTNLRGVQVARFTGSGYSDLAVQAAGSIHALTNDGTGNFTAGYSSLTFAFPFATFSVADANNDGYTDVYAASVLNGAISLGVNLVSGTATATTAPLTLPTGNTQLSATWPGNLNYTGSSATGTQTVTLAPTAVTLTSTPNPSTSGALVTFNAAVASVAATSVIPTGTIILRDGYTTIGTATLDNTGAATLTTSSLSVGTHALQAQYSGDSLFSLNYSSTLNQVVNQAVAVAPTLTWAPGPILAGTALSATQLNAVATNAAGAVIPGTYVYTPPAGAVLSTAGSQVLSVTFTPTDLVTYTVASLTVPITVLPANQPPLTTNLLLNPGAELGLVNGAIPDWTPAGPGTPTIDSGSFDGFAPHTGTYDFLGNNGPSDSLSQTVSILTPGVTALLIDSGAVSASLSFWEQGLNQGTPSDDASVTLTFLDANANTLSSVNSGEIDSHNGAWQNFTASYPVPAGTRSITYTMNFIRHAGSDLDAFIDDNSLILTTQVVAIPTTTTLTSSLNPSTAGTSVTFTATVTPATSNGVTATGTVIFTDGTNPLATVTLSPTGTATFTTSALTAATHTILAVYSGDTNFASSNTLLSQVVQPAQGLTFSTRNLTFGNQTVGTQSAPQSVLVSNLSGVTINIADILLILGAAPSDFVQTNNCPAAFLANATCTLNVSFTPHGVGLKSAGIEIDDDSTPSSQSVNFTGTGTGGILQVNPGNLKTIAGTGTAGYTGDNGLATAATLNLPAGVAVDPTGIVYIADELNNVVRKVDLAGKITTIAGTGTTGYTGDGGPATSATLRFPATVTLDSAGNLYIFDDGNNAVRKVVLSTGIITTFAGTGTAGHSGDGGPATSARLNQPQGGKFDKAGNLYVPDCVGSNLRKIDTSGIITTVAGNFTAGFSGDGGPATSAQLFCPSGVDIDATGNLYIADDLNNRIRKVDTNGIITTIAGDGNAAYNGDNISAASAELNLPNDLALDASGNLYIADSGNNRIRKIDTTGTITTVAGGLQNAGSAGVNTPLSLTIAPSGNLYFVDSENNAVREFFPAGASPFPATVIGTTATPQTLTLSNIGNVAVSIASAQSFTLTGNSTDFALTGGTCLSGATLAANGGSCTLQITFTPTAIGLRTLTVSIVDTALNSPQSFTISGTGATALTPILTWTPAVATIPYGTALGAQQLNAVATTLTGGALSGTFVYAPAAGTVLSPGTQTLSVTFTPTSVSYTTATATTSILVTAPTLTAITPNTAKVGDPATTINLTGTGFTTGSIAQVNGTRVSTTYVNATTLTAIVPATSLTSIGTLQVAVASPAISAVTSSLPFTVAAPTPSITLTGPTITQPGTQPALALTITNPYPIALTATFTLSFTSSVTPTVDDPAIQFASGGRTFTFTVPANSTTVPAIQLQAGTVAGTITIPLTLTAAGVNVTPATIQPVTIVVPGSVPAVTTANIARATTSFTVTIHGFSNTREVTTATFHFVPATGAQIDTPDVTIPVSTIFSGWFTSAPSVPYGSTFTYTQVFNVSDTAASIGSVQVTLTNSVGVSTTYTAQ